MHTYFHSCVFMYVSIYVFPCMYTFTHIYMYVSIYACMYVLRHTCMNLYVCIINNAALLKLHYNITANHVTFRLNQKV